MTENKNEKTGYRSPNKFLVDPLKDVTVKISSPTCEAIDNVFLQLKNGFNIQLTSPKMVDENKIAGTQKKYFQFFKIDAEEAEQAIIAGVVE